MDVVRLRERRAKPIWAGHPWVLSGAVEAVTGEPATGDVVRVVAHDGKEIGQGFFAARSRIRVRMLTLDPEAPVDDALFAKRVADAVAARRAFGLPREDTTVHRLVHSEGDGLPGLVVDRYGEFLVVQITARGIERFRHAVGAALAAVPGIRGAALRPVPARAAEEDLTLEAGPFFGEPLTDRILVRENGIRYRVDPGGGQKTGHFADHRPNRAFVAGIAAGRRTLDAFTGTGGFALAAAAGRAAQVTAIDSSDASLATAMENAKANRADGIEFLREDVFRALRRLEGEGAEFDLIILDPPRMASRRREVKGARRGYKELNLRAMRLLAEGGILATASCTGLVSSDEFEETVRDAAFDATREFVVHHRGGQGPDHPWRLVAPEGRYLKFLVGRAERARPRGLAQPTART